MTEKHSNAPAAPVLTVDQSEAGRKLLTFLSLRLEGMPGCNASTIQKWIRSGQVRVNSGRSKPFVVLEAGDLVRMPPFAYAYIQNNRGDAYSQPPKAVHPGLLLPAARADAALPVAKIIAVEPDMLVVFKPAGLSVHPGSLPEVNAEPPLQENNAIALQDSLSSRLTEYFKGAPFIPAPAHRLDKAASGLLLCGRSHKSQQYLHSLLASESSGTDDQHRKGISRTYLAWVVGALQLPENTLLEDYLEKAYDTASQREIMRVATPAANPAGAVNKRPAKPARSLARTLLVKPLPDELAGLSPQNQLKQQRSLSQQDSLGQQDLLNQPGQLRSCGFCSLLLVTLLSGRKHQIRVQLASRGHPIIGDLKYGGPAHSPMLLHAVSIKLPDERVFSLPPQWKPCWSDYGDLSQLTVCPM